MAKPVKVRTAAGEWADLAVQVPSANDPTFTGTTSSSQFSATNSSGDEGGEIKFSKSATNTTLNTGVTLDVYQDKVRLFETDGTNRGGYFDMTTLGAGVGTNLAPGLNLINTTNLSSATSVQINNIFSSTYDQYLMTWSGTCSAIGNGIWGRLSSSGTPNTSTLYFYGGTYVTHAGGPTRDYAGSSNLGLLLGINGDISSSAFAYINDPYLVKPTNGNTSINYWGSSQNLISHYGYSHNNAASYDGLYIYTISGSMTGTLRFYGIKK